MKILPISKQENMTSFGATIDHNELWSRFKTYLKYNKGRKGYHDTTKELKLVKRIEKAFDAHPSETTLRISEIYQNGYSFGNRGMVESEFDRLVDVEPSREDEFGAIEHLFRKLLNPGNKDLFNKLMGAGYENKYDAWWNMYIRPIWNDIVETFREETIEASKNHPVWDEQMNIEFRNRNIEIMEPEPPKQRKGSTLWESIKRMLRIK